MSSNGSGIAAPSTTAPDGYVFDLGFEAGKYDARERARLAALAIRSTHLDEDAEAETRVDWTEFPLGLYLHAVADVVSVGLMTPGSDDYELLDPDEADQLADALHAYATAARGVAQ